MADDPQRVQIWNALFEQAWAASKRCADLDRGIPSPPSHSLLGGNLTDDKRLALAALTLTAVAIEARATISSTG